MTREEFEGGPHHRERVRGTNDEGRLYHRGRVRGTNDEGRLYHSGRVRGTNDEGRLAIEGGLERRTTRVDGDTIRHNCNIYIVSVT